MVMGAYERWGFYHAVTVAELRTALNQLHDNDVLVPNEVKNLAVIRDFVQTGHIDFGNYAAVESYDE
jgi:hypothetical protein